MFPTYTVATDASEDEEFAFCGVNEVPPLEYLFVSSDASATAMKSPHPEGVNKNFR
jgi:hypothetical protein